MSKLVKGIKRIVKKKPRMGGIFIALIVLVVAVLISFAASALGWSDYYDDEFYIEFSYPNDWHVEKSSKEDVPYIVVSKERIDSEIFTPFSNITGVIIYPHGSGRNVVWGPKKNTGLESKEEIVRNDSYVLQNGDVWATYITYKNPPSSWRPFGFVLAKSEITNLEVFCEVFGETLEYASCEDANSDEVIRSGDIDKSSRKIIERIVGSISFRKE